MLDYRLTYGGQVVHDLGVGIACVSATCDMEAGIAGELKFEIDPTHPLASEIFVIKDTEREVVLEDRGKELFRGRVTSVDGDAGAMRTISAEGQLAYLGDSTVRDYATVPSDDLPSGTRLVTGSVLDYLITEHNKHVGAAKSFAIGTGVDIWTAVATTDKPTTLDEINRTLCEGQDRYLRARYENGVRYVDVLDGGQGTGTQTIVFGENLMDFASSRTWDDLVTVIIATGTYDREGDSTPADNAATNYTEGDRTFGLEAVGDGSYTVNDVPVTVDGDRIIGDELAMQHGLFEVARSYDATSPDQLLKMAAADLNPRANNIRELESVDVTAFDLSAMNPELEPIELLQWDRIFARPYHVDQWMPCSKVHIDVVSPEETEYHFGDIPKTLTRQSSLRMGLIQRGTGELIRKANGAARDADLLHRETNHNSERIDESITKAEEELKEATDTWSQHLDDETAKWYESLTDAEKEAAQGREELQKHLDTLSGTMDGVQELADAAQRTFYGVCSTASSQAAKEVLSSYLTKPGGQTFALYDGVVVEVKFTEADTSGAPTLNIAGTGARPIYAYGRNQGVWRANQVMRFVYDGSVWQCTNTPLYGSPLIVGNPAQGNLYSDGNNLDMRIGSTSYWHVDESGNRIGLKNRRHAIIDDDGMDVMDGSSSLVHFGTDIYSGSTYPCISSSQGLEIINSASTISNSFLRIATRFESINFFTTNDGLQLNYGNEVSFGVTPLGYTTNGDRWVTRSIVKTGNGSDTINLTASELGISSCGGYAFAITQGDSLSGNFCVIGTIVNRNNGGLIVKFSDTVSGNVRLNIFGFPTSGMPTSDPPNTEGPEIFGDPTETEQPTLEEATNATQ